MKRLAVAGLAVALLAGGFAAFAQEEAPFVPPTPTKQHEWLQALVGEWEVESEMEMGPGKEPMKCKGTESVRSLGGFFTVAESRGEVMGQSMTGIMTLGFDAAKGRYTGTWISNFEPTLWLYDGGLDAEGKAITLEAKGPDMRSPGKTANYRDRIELKGKDERLLTSSIQGEDGKWTQFMTARYTRKK